MGLMRSKHSTDRLILPSFLMFATVSLGFEGSFANIYLFHIFLSTSSLVCVDVASCAAGRCKFERKPQTNSQSSKSCLGRQIGVGYL